MRSSKIEERPGPFHHAPDVPASFMPLDAITMEMGGVEKFAASLGGAARYTPETARWRIEIGGMKKPDAPHATLDFFPLAGYNGLPETFKLTATYMSPDGALVRDMEDVEKIDSGTSGKLKIVHTTEGERMMTIIAKDELPLDVPLLNLVK